MKEVCEVDTAAPGMVSLEVAVVGPRVSGKHVSAPQTHVKLVVLRTIPGMAAETYRKTDEGWFLHSGAL